MNYESVKYPPAYYRFRARRALKGHWLTALQIALIVSLGPWLIRGIFSYTSRDMTTQLATLQAAMLEGTFTRELALPFMQEYGSRIYLFLGLEAAAYLIIPFLTLGMIKWMTDRIRGLESPVSTVFSRAGLFFKACGLQLLVILKLWLWMLPGMVLTVLVTVAFSLMGSTSSPVLEMLKLYLISGLPFSMIVPAFFAYLRYALAEYVLADRPETKIRECISRSKAMMKHNRRIVVLNLLMFFLMLFASTLLGGLPDILYYVLTLLFSLVITVYWTGTISAFYLDVEYGTIMANEPKPEAEGLN